MPRPLVVSSIVVAGAMGILPVEQTQADSTNFNTTLTALSGSAFQLDSNFSILYDLDVAYLDTNLDNVPDSEMFFGGGLFLGDYLDPEHYVLDFALPGTGTEIRPYFMGSELTAAGTVDWRLSYATTPGDASTIYSTILSGTADYLGGGLQLNITDGLEWPVNGWTVPGTPVPLGTHFAVKVADFDSLYFDYAGTLAANVVPGAGAIGVLGFLGLASGRRRR